LYVLSIRPSLRIAADIWYIVISLLAGVTFSPHATNFVKPLEYTGSQANLNAVTLYFSRLVLGVQLVLAGVASFSISKERMEITCVTAGADYDDYVDCE
jgi:hypothetical protein